MKHKGEYKNRDFWVAVPHPKGWGGVLDLCGG